MGKNIAQSLEEAVQFRKQLASSREEFLSDEINALQTELDKREDLTRAFYNLAETKTKLSELDSKVKTYNHLPKEKADWEQKDKEINLDFLEYLYIIKPQVSNFYDIFSSVYNAIYSQTQDCSSFSISSTPRSKAKLSINITFETEE